MPSLIQIGHPLASSERQLEVLGQTGTPDFHEVLNRHDLAPLETQDRIEVLQVNVGKLCNQTCAHCHVDAGPDRKEIMQRPVAEQVGVLGELHPLAVERYEFRLDKGRTVLAAELDLDVLLPMVGGETGVQPVPVYPAVREDLALVVDAALTASTICCSSAHRCRVIRSKGTVRNVQQM